MRSLITVFADRSGPTHRASAKSESENNRAGGMLGSFGFTIVELLVSIAVGSVFMLAVTTLIIQNTRTAQKARDLAVIDSYAENKIEALRSGGFLSLNNGTTDITSEMPNELKSPRSGSLVISSASPSIKQAQIVTTYNNQGVPKTYTYTTFIGELGVGQY